MKQKWQVATKAGLTLCAALGALPAAHAGVFTNAPDGSLMVSFRKTSSDLGFEAVANLGPVANYTGMSIGTTTNLSAFTAAQLAGAFSSLNDLSWSAFGAVTPGSLLAQSGLPGNTLWVTVPRSDVSTQTDAATRLRYTIQQPVRAKIQSILYGASTISSSVSNAYNTPTFLREATTFTYQIASYNLQDPAYNAVGDFGGTWPVDGTEPNSGNVENMTPDSFTDAVRSDLYEVRPTVDGSGVTVMDPHTGTSSTAYYVGYFQFNPDGTMSFTREASSVINPTQPPPAPMLSITSTNLAGASGNVYAISFVSSNSSTYKLHYTNSAGLTAPSSTWPALSTTIVGDGTTKSFVVTNASALSNCFFRVEGY